jgi:hypothetical protein
MFKKRNDEKQPIDHAIDATFNAYHPENDDAAKKPKLLKGLHAIKAQHEPKKANPDTYLIVAGNVLGILVVVAYERAHVFGTRALQNVVKHR